MCSVFRGPDVRGAADIPHGFLFSADRAGDAVRLVSHADIFSAYVYAVSVILFEGWTEAEGRVSTLHPRTILT